MNELERIALVGTARSQARPQLDAFATGSLVASLLQKDSTLDTADQLLLLAGTEAVYRSAGYSAVSDVPTLEPAPAETRRSGSASLAGILRNALLTREHDLLIQFLKQMSGANLVLPSSLLPMALNQSDINLRTALLPVIGARGRWLGQLNPEWVWVNQGVVSFTERDIRQLQNDFESGEFLLRQKALAAIRQSDPELGRQWLKDVVATEKPDHRSKLIETLEIGLSSADEQFLADCISDRSAVVKATVAKLLWKIPQSQVSQRMRERAFSILQRQGSDSFDPTLKLSCHPPEELDRSWVSDGVPAKPPTGVGQRSYWATIVLSAISPEVWTEHYSVTPEVLIESVQDDPFSDAVLAGWTDASLLFGANSFAMQGWVNALGRYWLAAAARREGSGRERSMQRLQSLVPLLAQDKGESLVLHILAGAQGLSSSDGLPLLPLLSRPWSQSFSFAYLKSARSALRSNLANSTYQWATSLFVAARAIPQECFDEALREWDVTGPSSAGQQSAFGREVDKFVETIRLRQQFSAAMHGACSQ